VVGVTYFERPVMPTDNYTQLPNHWARDPRLSDKAKGRLWSISTHAAGYRLTIAQMIAETKDGREAVYSSLAELVKFGYLVREQLRRPDGKLGEVRYTYGPACTEPAYVRNWGHKNDVSAGETAYGFPVYGEAVSGEPASKKLSSKKIKEKTSSSLSSATKPAPLATEPRGRAGPHEANAAGCVVTSARRCCCWL
jgi:hypothetical protein